MRFVYISSTRTAFLTSYLQRCGAATRERQRKSRLITVKYQYPQNRSLSHFHSSNSIVRSRHLFSSLYKFNIFSIISIDWVDSDVFFVEQISNEPSPQRNNSPNIPNSTALSHTHTAGMPSVSSIASPKPQILTLNDNSKEPTRPYEFKRQLPIILPSLNDLNLPPNPFNKLATMAVVNHTEDANNNNYSPQSPEPSQLSPISTPQ